MAVVCLRNYHHRKYAETLISVSCPLACHAFQQRYVFYKIKRFVDGDNVLVTLVTLKDDHLTKIMIEFKRDPC